MAGARETNAAECLVVCPPSFRTALAPWVAHREREGMQVVLVDSAPSAAEVRENLRDGGLDESSRFVVLVGDCSVAAIETADPRFEVPTHYRPAGPSARFGTTETLAGDAPYGDLDGDGVPEVAVGRLPVDSPQELSRLVRRILAYEQSEDFGLWRDTVQITAGVGGFGYFADAAIEAATRAVLTSALPPRTRLGVTYASPSSPFNPGGDAFFPSVLRKYSEGSLFWVYLGHGNVTELDRVPGPDGESRPVLSCDDVSLLDRPSTAAPIAILLACYAGGFDARTDALAERMLLAEGGPVAVLAGSRVTMPYGNAVASQGLIHAVYQDRVDRLGTAWLRAQRELATPSDANPQLAQRRQLVDLLARMLSPSAKELALERLEHVHLYNLLGDPTLRIAHPGALTLEPPPVGLPGQPVEIRGIAPHAGELTVAICHRPGCVPDDPSLPPLERYELANCIEVASVRIDEAHTGPFRVAVDMPESVTQGKLTVVVRLESGSGWSTASVPLLVVPGIGR